jgi:MFS family permease
MRDSIPRPGAVVWAVVLANTLLVQLVTFAVRPAVVYRALEVGVATEMIGVLSASFAVVPLLIALPSGALADRVGERALAVCGGGCLAVATVTLWLASDSVVGLVAGTVLLGAGQLCSVIAQQTWVANLSDGPGLDGAFGRYTFAASLGQALGPATLAVVGGGGVLPDVSPVFTVGVAASLTAAITALGLRRSARPAGQAQAAPSSLGMLRLPGLRLALLTSCIVLAAVDITLAYLPALGVERGIPSATIGVLLVVRAVASMTSRIALGRLVRWFGRRRTMVTFTVGAGAAVILIAVSLPTWVLVVAVALAGLGLGVGQPLTMSWLAESSPLGSRGRAMSLRLLGNRAGQVVIPSVTGLIAAGAGASGVLVSTGISLCAVGVGARRLPLDTH